jgi:hypothetical protein
MNICSLQKLISCSESGGTGTGDDGDFLHGKSLQVFAIQCQLLKTEASETRTSFAY